MRPAPRFAGPMVRIAADLADDIPQAVDQPALGVADTRRAGRGALWREEGRAVEEVPTDSSTL